MHPTCVLKVQNNTKTWKFLPSPKTNKSKSISVDQEGIALFTETTKQWHVRRYSYPGPSTSKISHIETQFHSRLSLKSIAAEDLQIEPTSCTGGSNSCGVALKNNDDEPSSVQQPENVDIVLPPISSQTTEPLPNQTARSQLQAKKAVTTLVFSLIFIVTQLPRLILNILAYGDPISPDPALALVIIWMFMNYAANIFIFYFTNKLSRIVLRI